MTDNATKSRIDTIRAEIVKALVVRGHVMKSFTIDDVYASWEVREQRKGYPHHAFGAKPVKIRVVVGDYGNKVQFPEGKDGVNIAKVVDAIEKLIESKKKLVASQASREERTAKNKPIVDALNGNLPGQDLQGRKYTFRGHAELDDGGRLHVAINRACTEGQAREFLAACDRIFGGK